MSSNASMNAERWIVRCVGAQTPFLAAISKAMPAVRPSKICHTCDHSVALAVEEWIGMTISTRGNVGIA